MNLLTDTPIFSLVRPYRVEVRSIPKVRGYPEPNTWTNSNLLKGKRPSRSWTSRFKIRLEIYLSPLSAFLGSFNARGPRTKQRMEWLSRGLSIVALITFERVLNHVNPINSYADKQISGPFASPTCFYASSSEVLRGRWKPSSRQHEERKLADR